MGLLFDFLSKVIYNFHDHHAVLRLLFISFSETDDVPIALCINLHVKKIYFQTFTNVLGGDLCYNQTFN